MKKKKSSTSRPASCDAERIDNPKSATFATILGAVGVVPMRIFGDLRSRWMIDGVVECKKLIPCAIS